MKTYFKHSALDFPWNYWVVVEDFVKSTCYKIYFEYPDGRTEKNAGLTLDFIFECVSKGSWVIDKMKPTRIHTDSEFICEGNVYVFMQILIDKCVVFRKGANNRYLDEQFDVKEAHVDYDRLRLLMGADIEVV